VSWPVVNLGDVVSFIGGSQPPKSTFMYEPQKGYVRLLQIRDYKSDKNLTFIPEDSTKKFCNKDDVMIGRYGPPVFQILKGLEGAYNVALMKAKPSVKVDPDYLYYFLKQYKLFRLIDGLSQRTAGQSGIDMDALKGYPMLLPPLVKQKRIAAILDKADAIRRKRQQAIQLADDFLRSVFLDMFGGESIERFNSLGDLVNIKGGGTPSKNVEDYWNGIIPWASVKDFKSRTITTTSDKITELGVANSATNIIPKGTIIIPTRMALGKVAISMADMAINQDLKALFINDPKKINRDYLQFFLESKAAYIDSHGKGATVKGITLDFLKGIMVPIPSIESQKKFSNIKTITLNMINKCDSVSANDFFNSLSQKAFAGEL
jgi:type I restriction enzyme S subunit